MGLHSLSDTLGGFLTIMPFLRFVIPELSGYNAVMENLRKLWTFIGDEIKSHEKDLKDDEPRDLIEAFLLEIKNKKGSSQQNYSIFNRKYLF